jgi:hypothetical protein
MRNEEYFKDLAKKYNFLVKDINWISKEELVDMLNRHKITYPAALISTLTANGKLLKDNGKYLALDEPVHYSVFRTLYEKASKINKQSYTRVKEEEKEVPEQSKIEINYEIKTTNFGVLKELIQKGVSDESILQLFPGLKQ